MNKRNPGGYAGILKMRTQVGGVVRARSCSSFLGCVQLYNPVLVTCLLATQLYAREPAVKRRQLKKKDGEGAVGHASLLTNWADDELP